MLKTYEQCPKKFYFRYVKNISMPANDEIFEFGKNIHALASYYLRKENIDKMEKSLQTSLVISGSVTGTAIIVTILCLCLK